VLRVGAAVAAYEDVEAFLGGDEAEAVVVFDVSLSFSSLLL